MTSKDRCPVCHAIPLGDPDENLNERMSQARSETSSGCTHQAMELALTLLSAAYGKAVDTGEPHLASLIVSVVASGKEDAPAGFHAAFVMTGEDDASMVKRLGDEADNPAQAVINLLVDMHDDVLSEMAKKEVSH